ncbi:hypothetical protein WK78_14315 [Burkholderia cepacia]|nr:hypothetical protein WK78_14315 [Burkholderia cepacia]
MATGTSTRDDRAGSRDTRRRPTAPRTFPSVCRVFSLARIRVDPGELLVDVAVRRGMHSTTIYPLIARIRATPATGTSLAR